MLLYVPPVIGKMGTSKSDIVMLFASPTPVAAVVVVVVDVVIEFMRTSCSCWNNASCSKYDAAAASNAYIIK